MINNPDLGTIVFPNSVVVTDQEIDVSILSDRQKLFYKTLFGKFIAKYQAAGKKRMVIGVAGPTGSGKSVIAALFLDFARHLDLSFRVVTLGIDAYHYPNTVLETKERKGKTLRYWKGAPDTYDVAKLEQDLKAFLSGAPVSLPEYSRETHDPIEHAFDVYEENVLLIVEGLWLLYEKDGWEKIHPLLDRSLFVDAEKLQVKNTVVVRHMRGGKSEEEANNHYDEIDAKNYDLVIATREKAQEVIQTYHGI